MKDLILCKGKILLKIEGRRKKVEDSSLYETNLEIRNKILIQEIRSNKILDETRDDLICKEGNKSIFMIIKNKRKKLWKVRNWGDHRERKIKVALKGKLKREEIFLIQKCQDNY